MFLYNYLVNLGVPALIRKKNQKWHNSFKNGLTQAPVIVNDLDL